MFTLAQILEHCNDDRRAALRRVSALYNYHASSSRNLNVPENERPLHTAKAEHYRALMVELETTK